VHVAYGVQLKTDTNTPTSTRNHFEDILIDGVTSCIEDPVHIGGGLEAVNNDFSVWKNCTFTNYANNGVTIADVESYGHQFINCLAQAGAGGILTQTGCTTVSTSHTLTTPSGLFTYRDVGKTIEVVGAGAGGALLVTTITAATGSTSVTMADAAGTSLTGTATVHYGTQCGVRASSGSFEWIGGFTTSNMLADVWVGANDSGPIAWRDVGSEGSRCLVKTSAQSQVTKLVTFDSVRFSGDGCVAGHPAIDIEMPGQFKFSNCTIGDPQEDLPITVNWLPSGVKYEYFQLGFDSCIFASTNDPTLVNQAGALWQGYAPQELRNCRVANATKSIPIDVPINNQFSVGATASINFALARSWMLTLTANCTITIANLFSGLGIGVPQRLFLKYGGAVGPWTTTWACSVGTIDWGTAGAPAPGVVGKMDIFEFIFDGTTVFARALGLGF
jgi:hypothetical protein